jgi:uncharacterized protein (TIGR01244 family)
MEKMMQKFMQMGEGIFIGGQPDPDDLQALAKQGVKTVIDFRDPSETEGSNAQMAKAAQLDYVNIPINKMTLSDADVTKFRNALNEKKGPYLLHCGSGARAGAMMLMKTAVDNGWSSQQALDMAANMGFDCDAHPEIKTFFTGYIERHKKTSS